MPHEFRYFLAELENAFQLDRFIRVVSPVETACSAELGQLMIRWILVSNPAGLVDTIRLGEPCSGVGLEEPAIGHCRQSLTGRPGAQSPLSPSTS
jgi:hypothetical protein